MSALAEALVAAQRRALTVLQKAYVAGAFEDDKMHEHLDSIGCTDGVDQDQLIQSLDVLRAFGGSLPAEAKPAAPDAPEAKASDAQVARIQRDLRARDQTPLVESDLRNLSKARASELIDQLAAGTYDPSAWDVPF